MKSHHALRPMASMIGEKGEILPRTRADPRLDPFELDALDRRR